MVITRFAPSPTGFLHIGSARVALFNWLFSKAVNGKFLLRIENTDQERSTQAAVDAIFNSLKWLELNWDGEAIFQLARSARHQEVVEQLLTIGKAYKCYLSPEEIEEIKRKDPYAKISSPWRDSTQSAPIGVKPTIRLKVGSGSTTVNDEIRGAVTISNTELDDMILLRSDGTPTYMLAVVVDDHDMKVTHVIRGDDHFTNTFRQQQILNAMSWPIPVYAHIPLTLGSDGAKLSKRHGALGVEAYKEMGYLPKALCNYLLRLGWSHNDIEIIIKEDAAKLFSLNGLNSSPAKFDMDKLNFLNAHYINKSSDLELIELLHLPNEQVIQKVLKAMPDLKLRAVTISELQDMANLYIEKKSPVDAKSAEIISQLNDDIIQKLIENATSIHDWSFANIKQSFEKCALNLGFNNGKMMQFLRATVVGSFKAPGIYETLEILGKDNVIQRISSNIGINN